MVSGSPWNTLNPFSGNSQDIGDAEGETGMGVVVMALEALSRTGEPMVGE
jgi:hypothetical protein